MEEKEAIEKAKENLQRSLDDILFSTLYSQEDADRDTRIILKSLKEKDKEIEKLKQEKEQAYIKGYVEREQVANDICKNICNKDEKIEQLEKQIDLMAEELSEIDIDQDICSEKEQKCYEDIFGVTNKDICKNCIKQYFENKVKGGK